MTTNERLDEIQSRLNNIEARFNNMDTRFNNLDSHLNNIENRLTTVSAQKEPAKQDIMNELKRAEIRDIRSVWLTLTVAGFGVVSAAFVSAAFVFNGVTHGGYMPGGIVAASAGLVVMIIGYCGANRLWWFKRRCE